MRNSSIKYHDPAKIRKSIISTLPPPPRPLPPNPLDDFDDEVYYDDPGIDDGYYDDGYQQEEIKYQFFPNECFLSSNISRLNESFPDDLLVGFWDFSTKTSYILKGMVLIEESIAYNQSWSFIFKLDKSESAKQKEKIQQSAFMKHCQTVIKNSQQILKRVQYITDELEKIHPHFLVSCIQFDNRYVPFQDLFEMSNNEVMFTFIDSDPYTFVIIVN